MSAKQWENQTKDKHFLLKVKCCLILQPINVNLININVNVLVKFQKGTGYSKRPV